MNQRVIKHREKGNSISKKKALIVAMYLPQYHEIIENNTFWGKGFTDWECVKKSRPLYNGHNQPNEPLNQFYYDLSEVSSIKWQVELARNHGIGGFAFYHYWFSEEKNLLTKPSELFLAHKEFDIQFMFAWDNISWKRSWSNVQGNDWSPVADSNYEMLKETQNLLVEYKVGNEKEWKAHFAYLSPFFRDDRYIKVTNKPVFLIWHPSDAVIKMVNYWNLLAKKDGWDGIYIIYKYNSVEKFYPNENYFFYEPVCSGWNSVGQRIRSKLHKKYANSIRKPQLYSYDHIWKKILSRRMNDKFYPGAFVRYDDTPRRGFGGKVVVGADSTKFKYYMKQLIQETEKEGKEFIFLTAWNEWGEGAFLEPDTVYGYSYLEALKAILL